MRTVLIISFLIFYLGLFGQDYVINWVTIPKEPGLVNFQIQTSPNNTTFTTLATILPKKGNDSNRYSYTLPTANNYVRIKTLFTTTTKYTVSKKVVNTNVSITNAILKVNTYTDNLSFSALNEAQVSYYSIERSTNNGVVWSLVGKLTQTGKKNYVVNVSRSGTTRKYRFRAFYKDDLISPYTTFQ